MSVSDKIKLLIQINNIKKKDLCEFLDIPPQSLSNKFKRGTFSVKDLIIIANVCGYELVFENKNKKISLDISDIQEGGKKSMFSEGITHKLLDYNKRHEWGNIIDFFLKYCSSRQEQLPENIIALSDPSLSDYDKEGKFLELMCDYQSRPGKD